MTDTATETKPEIETWIVVGEMSWGKGDDFREAFTNWFKHARPREATKANIYRFVGRHDAKDVWVDDFGTLYGPKKELGGEMTKLDGFEVTKKMVEAYSAWDWLCDDIEYGGNAQFAKAFDEIET